MSSFSYDIEELAVLWRAAKAAEVDAQERRRQIEDEILSAVDVPPNLDGTMNVGAGPYKIKLVGRMNRKVDADLLQELAAEHGLTEHLSSLFRWKPEINASAWKRAADTITGPLLGAITTTPGRPSFSIESTETKE